MDEKVIVVTANDIRINPDKVIDLLSNLARRVTSLEKKLGSVEAQLADTQGNVEKLAEELEMSKKANELAYLKATTVDDMNDIIVDQINEIEEKIEMALDDIVTLDERTQPKETPFFTTYQPTFHINTTEVAEKILDEFMKAANFGGARQ